MIMTTAVPAEKPSEKKKSGVPNISAILESSSWEARGETDEDERFSGKPTLKLDVKSIKVFRIGAVSYEKSRRSAMRYRLSEDKKSHS